MTPARLDLTIYRGITFNPIQIQAKDGTGTPVDLTGWQVFAKSRNGYGQPIDLEPTITNAATGTISIDFTAAETAAFKTGENQWDMIFERPTGERIGPYISGTISIKDPVTQT